MKTTLTKDDPAGWYLCRNVFEGMSDTLWWDGSLLRKDLTGEPVSPVGFKEYAALHTNTKLLRLSEELQTLRAENSALKAAPYPMRCADKPDCVGLWISSQEHIFRVCDDSQCGSFTSNPPYYYLGPIPVIPAEQKPPQVVTIQHEGKTYRAIPSDNPEYWTLLNDDGVTCGVAIGKVEAGQ